MIPVECVCLLEKEGQVNHPSLPTFSTIKRKVPQGVVMSGTEESNEHYKAHIPDLFIYGDYEPEVVAKIIQNQREAVKERILNRVLCF